MNKFLDTIRAFVRSGMNALARVLNSITGGRLSPNAVTLIGVAAHIPVALAIAAGRYSLAAGLLIIFGLFDALDGALARLQKRESSGGMLLDATTDRMKEILLYGGAAYSFAATEQQYMAVWAVLACGFSLLVSYVKAKGEAAIASSGLNSAQLNKVFADGLFRFEIRMAILVIGLLTNHLAFGVMVVAVGAGLTALDRLVKISHKLSKKQ